MIETLRGIAAGFLVYLAIILTAAAILIRAETVRKVVRMVIDEGKRREWVIALYPDDKVGVHLVQRTPERPSSVEERCD